MLGYHSIVAFEKGKIDGNGYGNKIHETFGSECGELFIINTWYFSNYIKLIHNILILMCSLGWCQLLFNPPTRPLQTHEHYDIGLSFLWGEGFAVTLYQMSEPFHNSFLNQFLVVNTGVFIHFELHLHALAELRHVLHVDVWLQQSHCNLTHTPVHYLLIDSRGLTQFLEGTANLLT